ncbi:MAG: alpha/beta hydrolase [Clostridiales bacterium]|jgi:pimeloyl-ACP methyl ester carboxylesterase|nr:alpha/beta hydrolase [Clostridiales bacterium]
MRKPQYTVEYFEANAVRQYLLHHRSGDAGAPVMLIVHGGPGFPDSNAGYKLREWWGDLFHLVSWDQRGCGKTLAANRRPPAYPITARDILDDMRLIIGHLKQAYRASQVYLLGISWGSVLCSIYALERPEDVKMYIAAGQYCNCYRNEAAAYAKMKEVVEASGSRKDRERLQAIGNYPEQPFDPGAKAVLRKMYALKRLLGKYGMSIKLDWRFIRIMYIGSPVFKFSDFAYFSAKARERDKELVSFLNDFEILDYSADYAVPVCYITGERDYDTACPLSAEYFEQIRAPKKLLRVIADASHNVIFDQPEAFARALADAKALAEADP